MRVYLDACRLSRLTDDQSQARIREEAEAVEQVLAGVRRGAVELVSSEALEDEVRGKPKAETGPGEHVKNLTLLFMSK